MTTIHYDLHKAIMHIVNAADNHQNRRADLLTYHYSDHGIAESVKKDATWMNHFNVSPYLREDIPFYVVHSATEPEYELGRIDLIEDRYIADISDYGDFGEINALNTI